MIFEDAFRAMGTDVDVLVRAETPAPPLDAFASVRLLFERQEARFSRFREDSLISRLNRGETIEDATFAEACRLAMGATERTDGLFNPLILPNLERAGYDRTFAEVSAGAPAPLPAPDPADCLAISSDCVRLRDGALDLGGIVKGWTVDLAVELLADGYPNLFVNAGGDLRAAGSAPDGDGWPIAIDGIGPDNPWAGRASGAVATSSRLSRRWRTGSGGEAHHLIDPRSGLPAQGTALQVTAWASETWQAEVWAKAALIGGTAAEERALAAGCSLLVVEADGAVRVAGPAAVVPG